MSFFDKILNTLTGTNAAPHGLDREQVSLLKQALEPLDKVGGDLGARTLAFVLEGSQESVLVELPGASAPLGSPGELLGNPGRLRWRFNRHNQKELEKLGTASLAARARFYASIPADTSPPLDVLIRLGKTLAAADAGKSLEHPGAPVPDWLQYLINDATFASFNEGEQKALSKTRPAWTIALIARLLVHEGLEATLALQAVFERKGLDSYYHDRLDAVVTAGAVTDFMRAHPQAVAALPAQLSASGRTLLVRRIGGDSALLALFAPLVVQLAVDASKGVRSEATPHLDGIDRARRVELLDGLLREGDTTQRTQAAELIARLPGDEARSRLDAALEDESSKAVQQAIRAALSRLDAVGDASALTLPTPPAWHPFEDAELGEEAVRIALANHVELLEKARLAAEEEVAENQANKRNYAWCQRNYADLQKIREADLRGAVRVLNGSGGKQDIERTRDHRVQHCVMHGGRVPALAAFRATHLIRWIVASRHWRTFWADSEFQRWLARQPPGALDLRALTDLVQRSGLSHDEVAMSALYSFWNTPTASELLPADRVWPFFAEHPECIDEGLGLVAPPKRERGIRFELGATLRTLATFPTIQARWLPRVMELALGDGKTYRAAAQAALSSLPDIGRRVIEALDSGKSDVRIEAANWLAELKYADAADVLTRALDKETRETVRAAYLTAIEALGADISRWLAAETLLAEAKKGLKAKPPAGLAWFPMAALPACRWARGEAVEPEIIRWWVVLACKLREPGGNALLTRYLGLLDTASRKVLGAFVLHQFIAQDTRHPPLEEGIAHAQAEAPGRYQRYQKNYLEAKPEHKSWYEADYNKSQEQVFEECKREKMNIFLGSAIGEKGILALIAQAPAHETVSLLQQYMRDNYPRRAQIEAMIEAAAAGNDPVLIQFLLGIARRYRTASVQEKARALVQQIADRNGWSQEQLADRTAPTAGLDESGTLELQYGERRFTLTLDAAMKPELRNPDGRVVKALPEPRQNDDAAHIKEAKSQYSTSKKELKQIIEQQTARLFEAMCAGRLWPQDEWCEYVHHHPIVGRLIQRLVWLEVAPDGAVRTRFRPTEDGSLIDAQDDEITLRPDSRIRIGHGSLVDAQTASAWVAHFKDYKLTPPFPQMTRTVRAIAFKDAAGHDAKAIADRLGWLSDTFTLRGTFNKLGYQRSQAEDGGFFSQYLKEFPSAGVRVAIEFSGNCLPEENLPAALKTLAFEDMKMRTWGERTLPLADVPPVLLAEAYADYLAAAQACSGYDAGWEKKMPW
jgi:hypothetical protein